MKVLQRAESIAQTGNPLPHRFSTLLVMQHRKIWWLKIQQGRIADHHVFELESKPMMRGDTEGYGDSVNDEVSGGEILTSDADSHRRECADVELPGWLHPEKQGELKGEKFYIDLILDTTIDEVDRVSVPASGSTIIDKYRQLRTLGRLRRDYPHAIARAVNSSSNERAALLHCVVPDLWSDWLQGLQERNIVVMQAVTTTQLACTWASRFPDYVLLCTSTAGRLRHLLIKDGVALFVRTIKVQPFHSRLSGDLDTHSGAGLDELKKTAEYIRARTSLSSKPLQIIDFTGHYHGWQQDSLSIVQDEKREAADSCATHDSMVLHLVAMFHGRTVRYETDRSRLMIVEESDDVVAKTGTHDGNNNRFLDEFYDHISSHFLCLKKRITNHFAERLLTRFTLSWRSESQWLLATNTLRWAGYLKPSLRHVVMLRRQKALHHFSFFVLGVAVLTFIVVCVNGFAGFRLVQRNHSEKISIVRLDVPSVVEVAELESEYQQIADSLFARDELQTQSPLTASVVMATVASVVSTEPEVSVERLTWVSLESGESFDSLDRGLPSVAPRTSLYHAANERVQLQIEGRISDVTLELQKSVLDSFVSKIKEIPNARDIHVLESPLDSALSSHTQAQDTGRYRLSLLLDGAP